MAASTAAVCHVFGALCGIVGPLRFDQCVVCICREKNEIAMEAFFCGIPISTTGNQSAETILGMPTAPIVVVYRVFRALCGV